MMLRFSKFVTRAKNIVFSIVFLMPLWSNAQDNWVAPESTNQLVSPVTDTDQGIAEGSKLYQSLCVACHGIYGKGDGVAAAGLDPKPANFYSEAFRKQSDGAVFWKLSKGRGVMAGYENMLNEKDRWALVAYLKSLHKTDKKDSPKKIDNNSVKGTFLFTQLINTQTVQVLPQKSAEFTIQHRFGPTTLNKRFINQFMGMDLSSNIRIAFAMALNENMYMELGRTKFGKVYDVGIKYLWLRQTLDTKTPFSLAVYSNLGVMTAKFPSLVEGSTFEDGSNFDYIFSHRLTYNFQLIMARKFSDIFSFQLSPVFIWRNLVPVDENNLVVAIPISGRFKLSTKTALLFEVAPVFNTANERLPLSLSYEIASSSAHAFQIVLSSTDQILESAVYTQPTYDYTKGQFVLGFNIKRLF